MIADPGRNPVSYKMCYCRDAECSGHDSDSIGQVRYAHDLGSVFFHFLLQFDNGAGIGFQPAIQPPAYSSAVEQESHPDIGHDHIYGDHGREQLITDREYFFHGGLIGPAADPAAGHGGESPPDRIGSGPAHQVRCKKCGNKNSQGTAQNNTRRGGKEHDQCLGPQFYNFLQVNADGQQYQAGGKQVTGSNKIEFRLFTRNDPQ